MRQLFNAEWYLTHGGRPSDISGPMPVLRDYAARGHLLHIPPHPLFDPVWYADQAGELPNGMSALEHYLVLGASEKLSPHPLFDPASEAAQAAPAGANPLVHYLTTPELWHLAPNDLFSGEHYLKSFPVVAEHGINPLLHYALYGEAEGRQPHRHFKPSVYRSFAKLPRWVSPLSHYLASRPLRFNEDERGIAFDVHTDPMVSIVIPVHGKWGYTRECLRSLAATKTQASLEVVVVDDASPDDTRAHLRAIPGVRVVAHDTNTGFVGACNSGIGAARGELVVLLNNDTRVEPGWLDPLIERIADPTIGLVGSKLIYPTGLLQEAGGVIFSDGSGLNYGKLQRPDAPEFNYARDVDYCSGASVMARASDLRRLGGLSDEFAPAYYDDTDLAFSIRSLGLRVVYEPRSVVVHDEGVSHGTDVTQGVKAYQVINREKFTRKWQGELAGHHFPNDPALHARAARRLQGKDVVVIADHYVPRPDEDSGSVRMMELVRTLREQNHAVVFIPNDRQKNGAYGEALQHMGVEVFHERRPLRDYLLPLRGQVSAVILSRFRVAMGNLESVRNALPDAPVILDTVDLHHLRGERESKLVADGPHPRVVETIRELELAMVRACDTTLVVSPVEQKLLNELMPDADVRVLSNVHRRIDGIAPRPTGRAGLLFVGGFAHAPNVDALKWFTAEVLPLIHRACPDVSLQVVGRHPDAELVAGAPPAVEYLGWVEDLTPLYAHARVSIAPLRYGAGVKGKIGEAMSHGVPVVATSVGAEGMGLESGANALVADSAEQFAQHVIELLRNDDLWSSLSKEGQEHIDRTLGHAGFAAALDELIPLVRSSRIANV